MNTILSFGMALLVISIFSGCISQEKAKELDKSYLMLPQNDIKKDLFSTTTPWTGLRSATTGSNVCSACASK